MSANKAALGAVVVGTGFGVFTHLRALRNAGIEVRALVGRDTAKTAARAKLLGVPRACASLREALDDAAVQIVTIATPPATHAPLVEEAVGAGKHVLCEKPFAMNLAEARAMLATAERARVVHVLGVEFRFATAHELLRRTIASGAIGRPRQALFAWLVPFLSHPGADTRVVGGCRTRGRLSRRLGFAPGGSGAPHARGICRRQRAPADPLGQSGHERG